MYRNADGPVPKEILDGTNVTHFKSGQNRTSIRSFYFGFASVKATYLIARRQNYR